MTYTHNSVLGLDLSWFCSFQPLWALSSDLTRSLEYCASRALSSLFESFPFYIRVLTVCSRREVRGVHRLTEISHRIDFVFTYCICMSGKIPSKTFFFIA